MIALVSALLGFLFLRDSISPTYCNFSREAVKLYSPDRAFVVENIVRPIETGNRLFLRNAIDSKGILICVYLRSVDVLWSKDSKAFAVNDWGGSNFAEAYLYRKAGEHFALSPLNIRDALLSSDLDAEANKLISNDDHNYVFIEKWDGSDRLIVRATGHFYEAPNNVEYTYRYRFFLRTGRFERLSRSTEESL
ncbi:hypothetical protein [Mesotoga prima]|uniref:hypothetical protein n=1 Tax=Mesotoga prima TaxID=1184387 RepID=UPI002FDB237C